MSLTPERGVLLVADTSVLLNFALIDRLDLLTNGRYLVHVPNHVLQEVVSPECKDRVVQAIDSGQLVELEIIDLVEMELYASYKRRFGDGESAALAVGVNRRWVVAIDEKGPSRREVLEELGPEFLLTTPLALAAAIDHKLIEPAGISAIRLQLAENRFGLEPVRGEQETPQPTPTRRP